MNELHPTSLYDINLHNLTFRLFKELSVTLGSITKASIESTCWVKRK